MVVRVITWQGTHDLPLPAGWVTFFIFRCSRMMSQSVTDAFQTLGDSGNWGGGSGCWTRGFSLNGSGGGGGGRRDGSEIDQTIRTPPYSSPPIRSRTWRWIATSRQTMSSR